MPHLRPISLQWALALALVGSGTLPVAAGVFGVPTNLTAAGAKTGTSADPPGWFIQTALDRPNSVGDTVRQIRLFIEVNGANCTADGADAGTDLDCTLDIKVFDPGIEGAHDVVSPGGGPVPTYRYQLYDPNGVILDLNGGVDEGGPLNISNDAATDDLLRRFSCNNGAAPTFTAANAGTVFGSGAAGTGCAPLAPGLYVFEISTSTAGTGDDNNAFGVQITNGAATPVHYNVYTASNDNRPGENVAPIPSETSFIIGSSASGGEIADTSVFFPYVNRGCTMETLNFDADLANPSGYGDGGAGTITNVLGGATTLTMSANDAYATNAVTMEPAGQNFLVNNYGMFRIDHTINTNDEQNWIDWRLSDYLGSAVTTNPDPRQPGWPIRVYLPNGYSGCDTNDCTTYLPPVEPTQAVSVTHVSGPNPPVFPVGGGGATRYLITTSLYNQTSAALTGAVLTLPFVNTTSAFAAGEACQLDGGGTTCTFTSGVVGANSWRRAVHTAVGGIPSGQTLSYQYQIDFTPTSSTTFNLTPPPNTTTVAINAGGIVHAGGSQTATVTTAAAHLYTTGDYVVIRGGNQAEYRGAFQITVTGGSTFTYTYVGTPGTTTTPSTGTYTATLVCGQTAGACGSYTPNFTSTSFARVEPMGPLCETRVTTGGAAAVLRALIRGVKADPASGTVQFATSAQRNTRRFRVYANGKLVGTVDAPQPDSNGPIAYRVVGTPFDASTVAIEEEELSGKRRLLGPFGVSDARLRAAFDQVASRLSSAGGATDGSRLFMPSSSARRFARRAEGAARHNALFEGRRNLRSRKRIARDGLKIAATAHGPISVLRSDLEARGLPASARDGALRLSLSGAPVSFTLANPNTPTEALVFSNTPNPTTYAAANTYVLTWDRTRPRPSVNLTRESEALNPGERRVEQDLIYLASAPDGQDPWLWDLLVSGGSPSVWPPDYDNAAGSFDLPGYVPCAGDVPVTIRVLGRTDHQHLVSFAINDVPVGSVSFTGKGRAVVSGFIPGAVLQASGNRLSATYSGGTPDDPGFLYLDNLDIGVPPVDTPTSLDPDQIDSFDATLPNPNQTDYLIIAAPEHVARAEEIATLKRQEGLKPLVVDVERIYDAFSAGFVEAEAVSAAIARYAKQSRLKYVLLVGDDTIDYRNAYDTSGFPIVPSLFDRDADDARVPSENRYADVDEDGLPDVAIGRLPVQTDAELRAVIAKMARQRSVLQAQKGRHIFANDNQGPDDPSFHDLALSVASLLSPATEKIGADMGLGTDAARDSMLAGLGRGSATLSFFGHGGPEVWADEGLLTVSDTATLASLKETVLLTWGCYSQYFSYFYGPSVNEALLLQPVGGALASFGPAGLTDSTQEAAFAAAVFSELLSDKVSLGEAIQKAKRKQAGAFPQVTRSFSLIGDPSIKLGGLNK